MYRTLVRDLLEAGALFVGEWAGESDCAFDAVNEAVFILSTLLAILGVDAALPQMNGDRLEWPLLAPRVEFQSH